VSRKKRLTSASKRPRGRRKWFLQFDLMGTPHLARRRFEAPLGGKLQDRYSACFFIGQGLAQLITGDILGTVTDPGGSVVPNAKVTVVNTATADTRSVLTTGTGDYVVNLLQPVHGHRGSPEFGPVFLN
jgi:hypothetical protein